MKKVHLILILTSCLTLFSCQDDEDNNTIESPTYNNGDELLGGNGSIYDESVNAFSQPIPGLEGEDELRFFVGNSFFNQNWVTSPASTTARDGLGAVFNARSCSACHLKDGRGRPPQTIGEVNHGLLLRLSIPEQDVYGSPLPDPIYGDQLQDQAILGVQKEGEFSIVYEKITGSFGDGEAYELQKPLYQLNNLQYGDIHPEIEISPRVGQQMIGLGLLEAISEADILSHADPTDIDNDGVSGRPNYVWDIVNQQLSLGRFGWKANQPSLLQQVAGAFIGDIGITSPLFPENHNPPNVVTAADDELDITGDKLRQVVLYSSTLAVPTQRNPTNEQVLQGKQLFNEIGCNKCHVSSYTTDIHPSISPLSHQKIKPFTDLLLHDMGEDLADNRPDFLANGQEWRTPPLWGIGLFQTVNNHTFYLHDGRARNLQEAILWHGGEGENSKNNFKQLTKAEREQLLAFLNSL
ncbi:MAG: c-type cytochrome [Cytophagales bacterium]|nr:c-type cytochrome [Cytophagales bacterium]